MIGLKPELLDYCFLFVVRLNRTMIGLKQFIVATPKATLDEFESNYDRIETPVSVRVDRGTAVFESNYDRIET